MTKQNIKRIFAIIMVMLLMQSCSANGIFSDTYRPEKPDISSGKVILDVPFIQQDDDIPTGCESISTAMALQYYGYDITAEEFIDNYLECGEMFKENGKLYGPDPNKMFAGSPYNNHSYGCFAPVIKNALKDYIGWDYKIKEVHNESMESLTEDYINEGLPVIIWVTQEMIASREGSKWRLSDGSGDTYQWRANEHCMLLVGYDDEHYYFNDPYHSDGVVKYSKEKAEKRYKEMDEQAVIIIPW